ncbi:MULTISPECIES: N-acetylmuramoyl-L-alanine amidase [unclassified Neptuniibacter]|jgi:N-acetylmuramoyl-L-alanine amidase|uniref:N-acetylmuramoyl-L-alanine amidase n=1 Tax=unclassified Neptuniibacter TaxID=2630693 RepID=UPI0026E41979|nr:MULTISPECIES: N-acetylmuramoyl-L-alanine amidase [unclassified Neptuniibacter]MDO6515103.1 N-acetylmuramoyl-L-alanine amidase [Neptuniibacter sp. 2_MG-2023]MDO6594841.1 N-acetylmuramoyl-L-alanine amidase [Neptuniibacter sp. 1_MG-2023]
MRITKYKRVVSWLFCTALSLGSFFVQGAEVEKVRIWLAPDHARLVFDLSGPATHKVFTLNNPERIVLDIENTTLTADLERLGLEKSPVERIRSGKNGKTLRLVLDLKHAVRPKSFELKPNQKYGHRLVLDLYEKESLVKATKTAEPQAIAGRDIVIAIDAGHGGDDPGAIGSGRVREKDVVLAMAKELKLRLDQTPGYKGQMTRTGDYYVSLRGRTSAARKYNADLFVSIHADAFKDPRARGASVWVLSSRGASSEMGRWLASKENSADLIGGVGSVSLDDKDNVLASVLLDMSMTASREDSRSIAKGIHTNIKRFARMHKSHVEQAGFVVLKSPDIPSILVETGFISNPGEAANLKTRSYQKKMADAIYKGIVQHFERKPPALTLIAQRKAKDTRSYKVVRGDTLSVIASKNGVSLASLRKVNSLKNDTIKIGQVLRIPAS